MLRKHAQSHFTVFGNVQNNQAYSRNIGSEALMTAFV